MKTLGPYRLLGELGRGGMGVVFRAQDTRDGRAVALKVPLGLDAEGLLRLRREAEAVQGLEHPHLVRVLELNLGPPQPYVAFELVDGETLERRVERAGPLPWPEAVEVVSQLASGLSAVHARGLLHRDVKPENVLLGPEGAKLADFGLAKDLDGETLTATGSTLGTPSYMAPEQVGSERERWSETTDVYGLTATLYFALTGLPPFTGATTITILHAVLRAPPPRPGATVPEVPGWLDGVCARGLAKLGTERYPSAIALRAALSEAGPGAGAPRHSGREWVGAVLALAAALAGIAGVGVALALRADAPPSAASAPPADPPSPVVPPPTPPGEPARPLPPEAVVAKVKGWLAQQDYAAAERLLTEQLPVQPEPAWVYGLRAQVRLGTGAKDAAERDAQEGVRLAPEDFAQWTLLAAVHNEQGRFEDAQSELQRGWVLAPAARRAEISMAEGQALCDLRRYAEALEVYDRAQREGGPPATVEVPRAVCLAQLGRLEDAQRALELALEDGVPLRRVDKVWRSLGGGPELRLVFARALATQGLAESALDGLGHVLAERPDDALARKARAELRAAKGDLRGALEDYERALDVNPDDGEAWRALALVRARGGDYEAALASVDRALALDPQDLLAQTVQAQILESAGRRLEALAVVDGILERDPLRASAHLHRAQLLLSVPGRDPEALRAVDEAARLGVPFELTRWPRAQALLGLRRYDAARPELEAFLAARPDHAGAWRALAVLQQDQGKPGAALSSVGRALSLEPSHPSYWLRARIHGGAGRFRAGVDDVTRALELAPPDPRTRASYLATRAGLWAELGDREEALADLARAEALSPHEFPLQVARAEVLDQLGDTAQALAVLDAALAGSDYSPRERQELQGLRDKLAAR